MIKIYEHDETFIRIDIDDYGVEKEFEEFFTFYAANYKYAPSYKKGLWDGKIYLYNRRKKLLYKGLLDVVIRFAKNGNYKLNIDPSLYPRDNSITREEVEEFCASLNISSGGNSIQIRDYQVEAIFQALNNYRRLLISPTGSGKSLIIYAVIRFLLQRNKEERIMLIVPTTMLVEQMFTDFVDYSLLNDWKPEEYIQLLYAGKDKEFTKTMMISTWQSLHAMTKSQPELFREITEATTVALFDEGHLYKSTEIRSTIEKFKYTKRRIGTTGTLDGSKVNELVLTGLMGPVYTVKTTRQLIDEGVLADIRIHIVKLKHPIHVCKELKGADYDTEINYLLASDERNQYICDLALRCKGATLITFAYVEKHGKIIYDKLAGMAKGRKIYYVSGKTDSVERQEIRKLVNEDADSIVVASEKLFSTGVNIPGLTNIIFAMPRSSPILIRQSIGRGLRKFDGKANMNLFDIADDLASGSKINHALRLLSNRMSIYIREEFEYDIHDVEMKVFSSDSLTGL